MKIFNLYGDDWDETRDREGWRIKEAFVGHHIGGFLIGASMAEVEPGNKLWPYHTHYANEEWAKLRRPGAVEFVQGRLSALSKSLGDKSYLDGDRFTAGDLMMTTVLRILKHTDIVTSDKRLAAYIERCTARPAFKRAFDAQIGDFRDAA